MTSKRELIREQRRWAKSKGLQPDARSYLETYERNLFRPLSAKALAAFERGHGSELQDTPSRPAKMRALHSSAVLAVNVFDHWSGNDAGPLLEALGLDSTLTSLDFETQFPTGLAGTPPSLDVALTLGCGETIGIESKFTEWLTPKRSTRTAFKDKYFEGGATLWANAGLPACQALAADMQDGSEHFRHLDAAQLLKHTLGLATQHGDRFSLYYVYFDLPCPASAGHRDDIVRFTERVGAEIRFRAISYQEIFSALITLDAVDRSYLDYLASRYFDAA